MSDRVNPQTMTDVTLVRYGYFPAEVSITIYDGDDDDLDNLLYQGFHVQSIVTVL